MKKIFKNVKAFTLAEILIALTVIGIISALTIPNLSRNLQAAQSKTAFKKTLAEINTAIADFAANEGMNLAEVTSNAGIQSLFTRYLNAKTTTAWSIVSSIQAVTPTNNTIANIGTPNVTSGNIVGTYYTLPNSTAVIVPSNIFSCGGPRVNTDSSYTNNANNACLIYIDTTARKGPNQQLMGVTSTSGDVDACAKIVVPEEDYMLQVGTGVNAKYCELTDDAVTDIYPVVLYNDRAYPATVAGYWVLNDLIGQEITPPRD